MRTNILLIGADRNSVESLDFLLETRGYSVTSVLWTGEASALAAETARADLLVFDLDRSVEAVLDISGLLAEWQRKIPVVVISSRAGPAGNSEVRIEKPIRADRFLRLVEELLHRTGNH